MDIDLQHEIEELIELRAEGAHWDFKQQWYCTNTDLIHDIICMANSPANRDCYIIIGIEDGTCRILGAEGKRKNQQNIIDLLRQTPKWAGGYIPEVYVKTILISDKEIDVIIIKQSDNTPFYLLQDYKGEGEPVFKGSIYTRIGDTNTPKTCTANVHDAEILWKRRFGLLYNPSQRAKHYLKDLDNWERVDGNVDKFGTRRFFSYYKPDPDYTVHLVSNEDAEVENVKRPTDINDSLVGSLYFYLFAFCNVSYHTDFSNREEVRLFYKDVPLFSGCLESVDEGRTLVIPPEFPGVDAYYIEDDFRFLISEFVFAHWCGNYSHEAQAMLKRVIPVYHTENEHNLFMEFLRTKGFGRYRMLGEDIKGEALERLNRTIIGVYKEYNIPDITESIAKELMKNPDLVINFASLENIEYDKIGKCLCKGKLLVDWLEEWRNRPSI